MPDPLFLAERLQKEKAVIKAAPWSFASACFVILVASFFGCWAALFWHYQGILEEKNATIEKQSKALDRSDKENERLEHQLANSKAYLPDISIPLKKRAMILADQMDEFQKNEVRQHPGDWNFVPSWYGARFERRMETVRSQLDELGIHSLGLDVEIFNSTWQPNDTNKMTRISEELRKLIPQIPEEAH
jgi:hypothetical protein